MLIIGFILAVLLLAMLPDASSSGLFGEHGYNCENPPRCNIDSEILGKLPFSKPELDVFCREMRNYFECLDHSRSHFEQEKPCEFAMLMSRAEKFVRTSCRNRPLRDRYVKHAKCFKKIAEDSKYCDKYARHRMMLYDVAPEDQKIHDNSEDVRNCMISSLKATCFGNKITEDCGEEAFKVYKEIFDGTQLYSQYCPGFTYQLAKQGSHAIMTTIDSLLMDA